MAFEDDPGLYQRLIHRGITRHEIERLYKKLRDKGYGEKTPDRRFQNVIRRLKTGGNADGAGERSSPDSNATTSSVVVDIRKPELIENGAYWAGTESVHIRAEDLLPRLAPSLRRKINRWAYRNGYRIVGSRERFRDFFTYLFPNLPDYVNDGFISKLLVKNGYRNIRPDDLGLFDSLDALHDLSRFFLGKERKNRSHLIRSKLAEIERTISDSIRRRDRFAHDFLLTFSNIDEKLDRTIDFIDSNFSRGKRIENPQLIRIVKQVNKFYYLTCRIDPAHIHRMLETVKDVNLAYDKSRSLREELDAAETIFCRAFELLGSFHHDLYPSLLKMMNVFYTADDIREEKLTAIYEFIQIKETDVLDYGLFTAEEKRKLEDAAMKNLEQDTAHAMMPEESFSKKFHDTLEILDALFPDSRIGRLEDYPPLIPYFECLVFRNSLMFYHEGQNIELLGRKDPIGQVMVLHRLLDNLLNSVNEFNLEKILEIASLSDRFIRIKYEWKDVYTYLFEAYVETITQYGRETASRNMQTRGQNARIRNFEEELNSLRNYTIRDYGYTISRPEFSRIPRLYLLADQLCEVLSLVGMHINNETVKNESVFSRRIYAELDDKKIVDFRFATDRGTLDYKPATHQIVRYLETKYACSIDGVPKLAQIQFFEIFRGIAELYRFLLNHEGSFYRTAGSAIFLSDSDDERYWAEFRKKTGVGLLDLRRRRRESGQEMKGGEKKPVPFEEIPVQKRIEDTFRNYLEKGTPFCIMKLSIDRFEMIPDDEHHTRNAVFEKSFATLSRHLSGGSDFVIILDGGEMLVFLGCRADRAIDICRTIISEQSACLGSYPDCLRGEPESINASEFRSTGTFSIGLYPVRDGDTSDSAVKAVQMLMEAARKTGNGMKVLESRARDSAPITR